MNEALALEIEQVWGVLRETTLIHKETERILQEITRKQEEAERRQEESERRAEEARKATEAQMRKTSAEIDRLSKNVGGLNRSMGELMEVLIGGRVWERFAAYPYNFTRIRPQVEIIDDKKRVRSDIDLLLLNDEWAMAVEVKRVLDAKDVDHHRSRMDLITRYPPDAARGKRLLGALACGVVDSPEVYGYAYNAGFFVLELSGESVVLVDPPAGFSPKEWDVPVSG